MYFLYSLLTLTFSLAAPATTAEPITVGLRLAFEPATLDWTLGDVPIQVINNVVEGLYGVDEAGLVVPVEAKELPRRMGQTAAWRISLRPGLKWSDGKPLRAADYVAAWTRLLDAKTASTYASLLFEFKNMRAIDEQEIEITLRDSKAERFPTPVLTHWATFPIRTDLLAAYPDWGSEPTHMAFNGPYKITAYKHGSKLELVPNLQHRTPGRLKKIEALIVEDDATALRLYESGRLHFMAELSTLERATLATRRDHHTMKSPVLVYLGIDVRKSILSDKSARKALSLAVDRSLLRSLLGPGHVPLSNLTPELNSLRPFKSDEARRLGPTLQLQHPEFGYFEKGANKMVVEFIQAQWKTNLGMAATLQSSEIKSYWKHLEREPFPVFLNTYGPPVMDSQYYFTLLRTDNPMNMGRWSNADYDQAAERGDFAAASRILEEETPIIPLYFRAYDYLVSPRLKGVRVNPMTSLFLKDAHLEP